MSRWTERHDVQRGADYDSRWTAMADAGESVHGEADLVMSLLIEYEFGDSPRVLDAGCGTGRVAIELAARGVDVAGVDLDSAMLDEARRKTPGQQWTHGDLFDVDLGTEFDIVVMAGNVMIFVAGGTEAAVLANMARHMCPGGVLVAGFQTGGHRLGVEAYDEHSVAAGLALVDRWSTWDRAPFANGDYVVSAHRRI
jgi:SAM-dependent methyltransferase